MKISILNKKSNKIIEKRLNDKKEIKDKINSETYNLLKKARGNQ